MNIIEDMANEIKSSVNMKLAWSISEDFAEIIRSKHGAKNAEVMAVLAITLAALAEDAGELVIEVVAELARQIHRHSTDDDVEGMVMQ